MDCTVSPALVVSPALLLVVAHGYQVRLSSPLEMLEDLLGMHDRQGAIALGLEE